MVAMTAKFDLDRFVDDLKRARTETSSQAAVREVIAHAVSEPRDMVLGMGEPTAPGLHTLYRAGDLTILNVIWSPLMVLLPHNHNMWATIGIYSGREDNILWKKADAGIKASGAASLSEKSVFSLPDAAVHSVINPIERLTGAIHVYGGDFFGTPRSEWDPETLRERPWDVETTRRRFEEAQARFQASRPEQPDRR